MKRSFDSAQPRERSTGLNVTSISILQDTNGPLLHTDDYESDALIIRRGASFYLDLLHDGFDEDRHNFNLEMRRSLDPKKRNGSLIEVERKAPSKDEWSFRITSTSVNTMRICVTVPANQLVSCYSLSVMSDVMENGEKKGKKEYELEKPVYILFNPWCEDDEVYMESEDLKNEYVLNDSGLQFVSGHTTMPWIYGQFTDTALRCTFYILESVRPSWRDTAREVARFMSSKCNSNDNDGLLVGNWSDDYSGGVKPWAWNSSVPIFKKYLESDAPVEFGQCWVFSAILTSLMRCLGIPCRSVTNYDSAHDSDNNCTFDMYYDEDDNMLDDSDDSCWNFHVWNDVWMSRPDLPVGMGGWQALDGTPQEESKGIYRCGPASLQSIKEGNVNHAYDAKFVFAEVNADTVYWRRTKNNGLVALQVDKNAIGSAILTKKPNVDETEDITYQYKFEEGSMLERVSVTNALKKVKNPSVALDLKDVSFSARLPIKVSPESGVTIKINATNRTTNQYTIKCVVLANVVRYTGVKLKTLEKRVQMKTLDRKEGTTFEFKYDASDYLQYFDENIAIRFSVMSTVVETKQVFATQKICNIHKPQLTLEAVGNDSMVVRSQDTLQVKISIPSVYGIQTFTGCSLTVESPIIEDIDVPLEDILADGSACIVKSFKIKTIKREREAKLVVTFNSNEIAGIHGYLKFRTSKS